VRENRPFDPMVSPGSSLTLNPRCAIYNSASPKLLAALRRSEAVVISPGVFLLRSKLTMERFTWQHSAVADVEGRRGRLWYDDTAQVMGQTKRS
jgi:hypothetical protein